MRRIACLGLVVACRFSPGSASGDAKVTDAQEIDGDAPRAWLDGYGDRRPITITPGGTFTDFTVGIAIASAELPTARPDGHDLVFTAGDARTVLPFEIERFGNNALHAWVRIADLQPQTKIYLYYGGPDQDLQSKAATWSAEVAGVWHMTDPPAIARDSTSRTHDLASPTVMQRPTVAVGVFAASRNFDGIDDTMSVVSPTDGSLDFGTNSFSYSMWVKKTQAAGMYDQALYKGGGFAANVGFDVELGTAGWIAFVDDGTREAYAAFGTNAALQGRWVHLAGVVDRTANIFAVFVDGVQISASDVSMIASINSTSDLILSRTPFQFRGLMDEVRIYSAARTQAWFAAEHANIATPQTFYQVGAQELR